MKRQYQCSKCGALVPEGQRCPCQTRHGDLPGPAVMALVLLAWLALGWVVEWASRALRLG